MKIILFLLLLFCFQINAETTDLPYEFLKDTKGFFELFNQENLEAYNCEIKLTGSIYKQLVHSSMKLGLTAPIFIEKYRKDNGFEYEIRNEDYSTTSKNLVLGLLTPVKAFEKLIKDFENKKSKKWLLKLRSDAKAGFSDISYNNDRMKKLVFLSKKDKHIDLKKTVLGSNTKTEWIKTLEVIIDPAYDLVHKITIIKNSIYKLDTTKETNTIKFEYKKFGKKILPIKMEILKDTLSKVVFRAEYRKVKDFFLYSKKEFEYSTNSDSKPGTLSIIMDKYYFPEDKSTGSHYFIDPKKEEEAERLYLEAEELLLNGEAKKSHKLLTKLVKKFPETSAGQKGKILIEGL